MANELAWLSKKGTLNRSCLLITPLSTHWAGVCMFRLCALRFKSFSTFSGDLVDLASLIQTYFFLALQHYGWQLLLIRRYIPLLELDSSRQITVPPHQKNFFKNSWLNSLTFTPENIRTDTNLTSKKVLVWCCMRPFFKTAAANATEYWNATGIGPSTLSLRSRPKT